jgi:hypothetical protein
MPQSGTIFQAPARSVQELFPDDILILVDRRRKVQRKGFGTPVMRRPLPGVFSQKISKPGLPNIEK